MFVPSWQQLAGVMSATMMSRHAPRQRWQRGMTLVELLVVIAIAAILTSMAAPTFRDQFTRSRLTSHSNTMMASLLLARGEAIKRNTRVVLCKSANGSSCTTSGTWEQGWIVFVDANNDASRANTETIVQGVGALSGSFKFTGDTNVTNYVSYTGSGSPALTDRSSQTGVFTLCDTGDSTHLAKTVSIIGTGRPRITNTTVTSCS